ncbi:MAG: hypothetical protein FCKEOINB_02923 [Nitrosomonas sp.]|nr:hypothetical protein [Nitrosomonas sp.]
MRFCNENSEIADFVKHTVDLSGIVVRAVDMRIKFKLDSSVADSQFYRDDYFKCSRVSYGN